MLSIAMEMRPCHFQNGFLKRFLLFFYLILSCFVELVLDTYFICILILNNTRYKTQQKDNSLKDVFHLCFTTSVTLKPCRMLS